MATQKLMILLIILPFIFSLCIHGYDQGDVSSWCAKTPHPKPCEYYLSHNPNNGSIKGKPDFLKMSLQLALDRALDAKQNTNSLGPKCRNDKEKAAWTDCLNLYEDTILRLTRTLKPNKHTTDDAQTWLSSALTNLETCRIGFQELGVADYILPLMSNNVSDLISNTLSINGGSYSPPSTVGGLPTWVKPGDRKLLQSSSSPASEADLVVAEDGSGDYTTIQEAVTAASKRSGTDRYIIYIKEGTYEENIAVTSSMENIMFVGDGIGNTIVTGSKSVGGGSTTFNSATVAVVGDGFIGRDITFRNTAGAANHQAVALRSDSDLSVFYKCSFEGYQDTLYVHSERQFYRECDIYGTVDFIFGNSAVVFQKCNIYPGDPPNKTNTITAQGRTDPNQNTGISILDCNVTAAPDLEPVQSSVKTYLGRPWKEYSRTVFMKTALDSLINSAGWLEWDGDFALSTLYYGEYENTGSGSSTTGRVTWSGYHAAMSSTDASNFTVANFIAGASWLPDTDVPYTSGL